ncbi:glucose-6-phosphate dehydrogenase [Candidatus Woesearchaeota archaeon]|nr:glucose-6-phosphate dehydrogenase [Candidatus Woesearchaeota archaeon]
MNKEKGCVLAIFGATGDLTHKKLLPALYFLELEKQLDEGFTIVAVARRPRTTEEFRKEAAASIQKFSKYKPREDILSRLLQRIHYHQLEFNQQQDYTNLRKRISELTTRRCRQIFYLAVPPEHFEGIVQNMEAAKLADKGNKDVRIVFEKPFGNNLRSAQELNKTIRKVFDESQIYRIDHYLAKELVQSLLVLRFGNSIFEPLWNNKYIEHVQITVAESIGIEGRAGYYEKAGALKDIVQNHIMQLLSLVAMQAPKKLTADDIRDEKVKVLQKLSIRNIAQDGVKGQYGNGKEAVAYREEKNVPPDSKTDTYFALKVFVNNATWNSVPFYIRTGKRLKERATEIILVYKPSIIRLFPEVQDGEKLNRLTVRVQPDEGISLTFNTKVPGNKILIEPVTMDFCHECTFGPKSAEAYERLLYDIIQGDQTLFTRWDEVELSWKLVDRIAAAFKDKAPAMYPAGSWGPKEADMLIERDGRKWVVPEKPRYAQMQVNHEGH